MIVPFLHIPVFLDKTKDSEHPGFPAPKPLSLQPGLNSSRGVIPHPVPSLVPSHLGKHHAATTGAQGALAASMITQRSGESAWFSRQRGQGPEREGLMDLGLRSPGKATELRRDNHRWRWIWFTQYSRLCKCRWTTFPWQMAVQDMTWFSVCCSGFHLGFQETQSCGSILSPWNTLNL